jgi:hypothetical protein
MLYKKRTQAPGTDPAEWPIESPAVPKDTKPQRKHTISLETVMLIAVDWHSGQWSALYAFGSSGILLPKSVGRTLREINENLQSADLRKSQLKRLQQLEKFIAGHSSAQECIEQPKSEFLSLNK